MSLAYINRTYGLHVNRGSRLIYLLGGEKPILGTVTSARGPYICIKPDFDPRRRMLLHPTWNIVFLADSPLVPTCGVADPHKTA